MEFKENNSKSILSNIEGESRFFCFDGKVFCNLEELQNALKTMSEESFFHHVNSDKNDFSNWIRDVLHDVKFADKVKDIQDAKELAKKIRARITYIKKQC